MTAPSASVAPAAPESRACYVFAGVRFHPDRHLLLVDGQKREAQPLVLRLLALLCEARGSVLSRPELFDRLWPRQQVTDESLTQLTARLREALAPYSSCVLTVRRVGLRLDSPLQTLVDTAGEAPPAALAAPLASANAPSTTVPPVRRLRPSSRWLWVASCLLVAAACVWLLHADPDAALAGGRGLTERDLSEQRADTATAVRNALLWELQGKREEAQIVLEIAHANDPDSPLPAIYLAFLNESQGRLRAVRDWKAQAELRLQKAPSMRLRVLLNLLDESTAAPTSRALASLRVAADTGADSAELRLGRAYTHLARVERAAALAEMQAVDIAALDELEMPVVIADLGALGDMAAAERALTQVRARLAPAALLEVEGRMAATRQQWGLAVSKVDAALAAQPDRRAVLRLLTRAALYRAQQGDYAGARAGFERVLLSADPPAPPLTLHNTYILLAGLPEATPAMVRDALERAANNADANAISTGCWEIELVAGLQRLPPDWVFACQAPDPSEEAQFPGFVQLRAAFAALRHDDPAHARGELANARAAGIAGTLFGPHALALAAQLGEPAEPALPTDPASPTWSRHVAYWHQRDLGGRVPAD